MYMKKTALMFLTLEIIQKLHRFIYSRGTEGERESERLLLFRSLAWTKL